MQRKIDIQQMEMPEIYIEADRNIKVPLSSSYQFVFNTKARIISTLSLDNPKILAQQQFTRNEWCVITVLLSSYPYYASYESLLASLTSLSLSDCRKRIHEAQLTGSQALKRELKPVHRALSGIRKKFSNLSPQLRVRFMHELGYILATDLQKHVYMDSQVEEILSCGQNVMHR